MPKLSKPLEASAKKQAKLDSTRKVLYDKVSAQICCAGDDGNRGPITVEEMRAILQWEDEITYGRKLKEANPKLRDGELTFPADAPIMPFKDAKGQRVVCWALDRNRPPDKETVEKIAQEFLNRCWAGPTTMPGETINGESMAIGRTGRVLQGQHRGLGLVRAAEEWAREDEVGKHWRKLWPDGPPVLETAVMMGISESSRVIQTIDNVKTRILADTYFTSTVFDHFRDGDNKPLTPAMKQRASRMLDNAVDMLWRRLGADRDQYEGKQTHSASHHFLDRHPSLVKCVEHIYGESAGNRYTVELGLQPGHCAAMMYLMAASGTIDTDLYWKANPSSEKKLDMSRLEKAEEFWTGFGRAPMFEPAVVAIKWVNDVKNGEHAGRLCVLSKAWKLFIDGEEITQDNTSALYEDTLDRDGRIVASRLADRSFFGGCDLGDKRKADPASPTPDGIAAGVAAVDEERKAENRKALAGAKMDVAGGKGKKGKQAQVEAPPIRPKVSEQITELAATKTLHGGRLCIYRSKVICASYMEDADVLGEELAAEVKNNEGLRAAKINTVDLDACVTQLVGAGKRVAVLSPPAKGQSGIQAVYHDPEPAPTAATEPAVETATGTATAAADVVE